MVDSHLSIEKTYPEIKEILEKEIYSHNTNKEWISDPYAGFKLKKLEKKIGEKLILKTNSLGLRANEFESKENFDVIFLGGSYVYGSYASAQDKTITEFYSKLQNEKVLNAGIGGHVLKQHISLYHNYLSNLNTKKIFLIFGFNDMGNCYQGKDFSEVKLNLFNDKINQIIQKPIKESLKIFLSEILRILNLNFLKKLINKLIKKNHNLIKKPDVKKYILDIIETLKIFNNYCSYKKIDLKIILQPTLLGVNRKLTKYETNYLKNTPDENKRFCKNFFDLLDKELSKFDNYLNFKYIYDETQSDVFIDIVHTCDFGNKIFAENLVKVNKKNSNLNE